MIAESAQALADNTWYVEWLYLGSDIEPPQVPVNVKKRENSRKMPQITFADNSEDAEDFGLFSVSYILFGVIGSWTQSRQSAKLFLQSSEFGLPQPLTCRRVPPPPPPWFRGEGHTRWRERGWESPNSNGGTYTVVLFIYMYFFILSIQYIPHSRWRRRRRVCLRRSERCPWLGSRWAEQGVETPPPSPPLVKRVKISSRN
jgi:hypothetical protein